MSGPLLRGVMLEMERDILFGSFGYRGAYREPSFRWISWRERWLRIRCAWFGHGWTLERSTDAHPRPHWLVHCLRCKHVAAQFNDPVEA